MTETALPSAAIRLALGRDDRVMRGGLLLLAAFLLIAVALPLYFLLSRAFQSKAGDFVAFANYAEYFATPALSASIYNRLTMAAVSKAITANLAFVYAYGLTRSCSHLKALYGLLALMSLLSPSLLPALS